MTLRLDKYFFDVLFMSSFQRIKVCIIENILIGCFYYKALKPLIAFIRYHRHFHFHFKLIIYFPTIFQCLLSTLPNVKFIWGFPIMRGCNR